MSPKKEEEFPFQGIPQMLYMDNGPIAKSLVFQKVMGLLGNIRADPFTQWKRWTTGNTTQPELKERKLLALIQKCRKTVVLFVDEAHDIQHSTLVQIKRIIELVRSNGGTLSVVLVGHPKLKNDLRRPSLEEIGARD